MSLEYNNFVQKRKSASLIMLINEEEKLIDVLREYFFSQGFSVVTSNSAGLSLEKTNQLNPDIYVLDIMMDKTKGNSFLEKLEKSLKLSNTPFIFLTSKGMTKDRIEGYGLGCSAYITKPFDPAELLAVIKNILLRQRSVKEIYKITSKIKKIRTEIETYYYLKQSLCLTPREKTVIDGVILGCSNGEIAFECNTSTRNIEKYMTRLLYKTKTKNRTELARFIYRIPKYQYMKAEDGNRTRE
jgi:DNA-binding NarL/FixJ family response regulator